MPCEFDWTDAAVVKTFTGFVSGEDFARSAETVSADPRFDGLSFIINDFRRITGHTIDEDAYLRVAASRLGAARTNPNFRVVMVASQQVLAELRVAVLPAVMQANFDPWFCETLREAHDWIDGQPVDSDFRPTGF